MRALTARVVFHHHSGWRHAVFYCIAARQFSQLASRRRDRLRIVFVTIALALIESTGSRWQPRCVVRVDAGHGVSEFQVAAACEIDVLHEVFRQHAYAVELDHEPRVVIDGGSNIGATLVAFAGTYPQAQLVGLEPNPAVYERLQANTRKLERLELRDAALSGGNGTIRLKVGRDSWAASEFESGRTWQSVTRPAITIESLLDELGARRADLVKLDVEGSEYAILAGVRDRTRIGVVLCEWHGDIHGRDVAELAALLPEHTIEVRGAVAGIAGRCFVCARPRSAI
jgi:FkbM family methyltransferase